MWKKIKKEGKKLIVIKELLTINQQVILASSSKTRIKKLEFIKVVKITNHKINEEKIKKIKQGLSAKSLAKYLAKGKLSLLSKIIKVVI